MKNPIYGLVLAGGKSERMGRDKALLAYHGTQTQLEHTASLLQSTCEKVFVSMRKEQEFPLPPDTSPVHDSVDGIKGPLCGILSAMAAHPEAHWLVVACDLPFLKSETLEALRHAFDPARPELTAYRSSHDQLPEPLCAIYPAQSEQALIRRTRETGKSCPRKLLIDLEAVLINQNDPRSLDNINTEQEFHSATEHFHES